MIPFLGTIIVVLLGLCVGSFLNVVIFRLQKGESALRGRSYCPSCKHQLAWYDLVPLLSFTLLLSKCRYCKKPISWQYPLVEISTAVVFLLIFSANGGSAWGGNFLDLLSIFTIASALIVIFVYDLKHYLIPDVMIYLAIAVAGIYGVLGVLKFEHLNLFRNWKLKIENLNSLENVLISAFFAALFFFAIYFISKGKWMGFGDVELAFFMGLFLGWPNVVVALFSSFFLGAVVGLALIALRKKQMKSEVPFAPFLIVGTFLALFFGNAIVDWYSRFLLV